MPLSLPSRSLELEAAPDADTPRPVGVGLLLCMLERGGEGPGRALIDLAARLQAQGDGAPPEVLLMREACYRWVGEGGDRGVSVSVTRLLDKAPRPHASCCAVSAAVQQVLQLAGAVCSPF